MKHEKQKAVVRGVTRRQVIGMAAAPLLAALVDGCGGGGSSASGPSGVSTRSVTVGLTLPSGMTAASTKLFTGYSVISGPGLRVTATVTATVTANYVSSALVVDASTGKAILVGMIDPTAAANTIDATSTAATLLFYCIGGSQLYTTQRNALWNLIVADPATTAFAAVIQGRLAADKFALDDGDAQIVAGLATAVQALSAATLAAAFPTLSAPSRSTAFRADKRVVQTGRATLPASPSPAVDTTFGSFPEAAVVNYNDGTNQYYDLVQIQYQRTSEAEYYYLDTARVDSTGASISTQPVQKLTGPISMTWPTGALGYSDPYAIPLANATDQSRYVDLVFLSPIFDAPTPAAFSQPALSGFVDEWKAQLTSLYQRAGVMIADSLFLEALGLGGTVYDNIQVAAQTTQLNALGGAVATALTAAGSGTDLIGSVNRIVAACTANTTIAGKTLATLQPITGNLAGNSADRTTQLMKVVQLSKLYSVFAANGGNGQMLRACENVSGDTSQTVDVVLGKSVLVQYALTPDSPTYTAGGSAINIAVSSQPSADNSLRKYSWKLSGAGACTLSDGAGNKGTAFNSSKNTVTFTPSASATGVQSVQVTVYNIESGTAVLAGSAHTDLNLNSPTTYALTSQTTILAPGSKIPIWVGIGGDTNIDLTNLSFIWTLSSTSDGGLVDGSITDNTVTTSTNEVIYQALPTASDGDTATLKVTVRKTDPSTGAFTNLAVLSGTVQIDVLSGCELSINNSSFPLTDLFDLAESRYLVGTSNRISTDSTGYVFSGAYGPLSSVGGDDYVYVTLRPGSSPTVGQTFSIVTGDTTNTKSSATLGLAEAADNGQLAYSFLCSGTAQVMAVTHDASGTVTYAKFNLVLNGTDASDGGRTCQVRLLAGV